MPENAAPWRPVFFRGVACFATGEWEADFDVKTATRPSSGGEQRVMRSRDCGDDRESEADTVAVIGAVCSAVPEGLEELLDCVGPNERTGVAHCNDGPAISGRGPDLDPTSGLVVAERVVDEVGDQALGKPGVSRGLGALELGVEVEPTLFQFRPRRSEDGPGDRGKIDGHAEVDTTLGAGEREQRLDQAFLLRTGSKHPPVARSKRLDGGIRVAERDLGECLSTGERGAQLVRGVGDELPLGGEGGFQAIEKVIEGVGELLQLVVGAGERKPPVEIAGRDLASTVVERAQRPEDAPGGEPAEQDRGRGHQREGDPGLLEQEPQLLLVLALRERCVSPGLRQQLLRGETLVALAGNDRHSPATGLGALRRGNPFRPVLGDHERAAVRLRSDENLAGRLANEHVGDRQQRGTGDEKEARVDDGEPQTDGASGQPKPSTREEAWQAHRLKSGTRPVGSSRSAAVPRACGAAG
ncbi:MAG TPA: hypothetical protein VE596_11110 [Gaiellaceae bacterium]|nr:hypothetical protein [Gaiellaceae bacterium]